LEAATSISSNQTATALEQPVFRNDFEINRTIPAELDRLLPISSNFYWSWQAEGAALFRAIDAELWDQCEQNPRLFLSRVTELRLRQMALDPEYVEKVEAFNASFESYIAELPELRNVEIAYFCAEYGVHNSLPNYSGGLGILAGDHLKSASDLNLPLTAIGLLYRYGYFRQKIGHDGWQQESYNDVFSSQLALSPVVDQNGERVTVSVHIRGREVVAQAWLAQVGRIPLYLLDTNVLQNSEIDRLITGHLYGGDSETRIVQEKVLGIGGVRLLRKLGKSPTVFHLNEGHAAFSTLELAHEFLNGSQEANFADAVEAVRKQCVFTTHTPVAAGNDAFDPKLLIQCFSPEYVSSLKLTASEFLALGRANLADDSEFFGMTPFAIRMCRSANGVSEKHGEVSRSLWLKMFPDLNDSGAVPITSVTNGVHPPTWIAPAFQRLYGEALGPNWHTIIRDAEAWGSAVESLSDQKIWETHQSLKQLLIAFVRERTKAKETGWHDTINERADTSGFLSADVLTIGFARRVAAYKRWDLIFADLPRLLRLVDNEERPVQFVFAGKAHPQDRTAKAILQDLMSINNASNWQRRAVFIQDYDQEIARYLVHGVDVWMNVPRRPMEASGTSGMKAAMNGALNFSILDGWWIEGYNGDNGFAIGDLAEGLSEPEMDAADAAAMYAVLENDLIPAYYNKDSNGLSADWIRKMRSAFATLTPQFSSDRMLKDYLENIYEAA
jgi:starch phosphorylase